MGEFSFDISHSVDNQLFETDLTCVLSKRTRYLLSKINFCYLVMNQVKCSSVVVVQEWSHWRSNCCLEFSVFSFISYKYVYPYVMKALYAKSQVMWLCSVCLIVLIFLHESLYVYVYETKVVHQLYLTDFSALVCVPRVIDKWHV
jgi:hypothetical protein